MTGKKRLHPNERGIKHIFGKRYMWLLDHNGQLGLHKVDDKGNEESRKQLEALFKKQDDQA